jgi:hypothetical protein
LWTSDGKQVGVGGRTRLHAELKMRTGLSTGVGLEMFVERRCASARLCSLWLKYRAEKTEKDRMNEIQGMIKTD